MNAYVIPGIKRVCNEYDGKICNVTKRRLLSIVISHYNFKYRIDSTNYQIDFENYKRVVEMYIYISTRFKLNRDHTAMREVITDFQNKFDILFGWPYGMNDRPYRIACEIIESDNNRLGDLKSILAKIYFGWLDKHSL